VLAKAALLIGAVGSFGLGMVLVKASDPGPSSRASSQGVVLQPPSGFLAELEDGRTFEDGVISPSDRPAQVQTSPS